MGKRIVDAPLVEQVDNSQRFPVGAVGDETAHSMSVGQLKEHIIGDSDTPDSVVAMIEDANDRIDKEIADRQQADRDIEALITDDIRHIEEAEVERKRNEIARENNEATRRQNEMQRQEGERTRQDNEQQRIDAEGTRDQRYEEAEEERFQLYNSAESSRTSIFNSNESTRSQQEHVRVSNENVRNQNEATRNTAETRRQQNENSRIASEDTRQQHEQLRMSAEVERMTNESQRVTAERERQSIFNQSQTQRDNDFNAAQTLRQTTFENNESERDGLVNAEIERLNQYAITRVELVCDDEQHITMIDDPTPLTYAQVKALVDDTTKFVTLRYLDMWWMLPSYDDGGAIMFTSSDIQGGHVMVTRVILNDDGQMNNYSIVAEDADNKTDDMSVETAADGHRTYPTTHAVNGALATKANTDGYYTELTSGMAENLLSPDGITDEEPYIYRTSAGSTSISTGVAEIKSLYGNSIVWNQLAKSNTQTQTINGITITRIDANTFQVDGTATANITNICLISGNASEFHINLGHKFYWRACAEGGSLDTYYVTDANGLGLGTDFGNGVITGNISRNVGVYNGIVIKEGTTLNNAIFRTLFIDLTQMFGEGNEPTTVEQFKQWFPNDYYEYNEGDIINVNIDGLKTVGFNAYNNGTAKVIANKQYQITGTYTSVKYSDGTDVVIEGGFFTPTKNDTIAIAGGGADTCVHLVWSGYRNGDYEPYNEHNINIPVKEIKDADNNVLFPDGLCGIGSVKDEITSDKAIKHWKKLIVPTFINGSNYSWSEFMGVVSNLMPEVCSRASYINTIFGQSINNIQPNNNAFCWLGVGSISIYFLFSKDEAKKLNIINAEETRIDIPKFNAWLSGLSESDRTFYYNSPNTIEVEFKDVPQTFGEKLNLTYFVDDFGTEEFTTTEPTAPVKHSTFYMTNLRDKIRNIDGNTDAGALMNGSVDNLLTTLGTALGGTLTKTWDAANKKWTFSFTPNTTTLNEEGGEQ